MDGSTLGMIETLCKRLEQEGVHYCHWKSTAGLDRSARGETDLDLLVRRADCTRFSGVLSALGFKFAKEDAADELPGVLHAYGHDEASNRLVHVHVHYQLVVGHDRTKNYRLPVEAVMLASVRASGVFRIPSPEVELVMLVVRLTLKYSTWDAIVTGLGSLRRGDRRELEYLEARVDPAQIESVRQQILPTVSGDLFEACRAGLKPGVGGWRRALSGARLQRALRLYARRSHGSDVALKLTRRIRLGLRSRIARPRKRRLACGGVLVGLVGGDGAGKSTALSELERWLGPELDVRMVHMGKPRWSLLTQLVRAGLKTVRLGRVVKLSLPDGSVPLTRLAWLLCTARDRQLAYRRARRLESNGSIVLCDRFPLEQIRLMDGPQIDRLVPSGRATRLTRWMASREESYYAGMLPPDLVIVLRVPPEVAVRRKPEDREEMVRERSGEIWELDWSGTSARVVDAERDRDRVIADVKSLIWAAL